MKTYLLLLRGINVGGKKRLSMGELKELLEKAGCLDVKTYINSSNVFLRSDEEELQFFCQKLILDHFHMAVSCQVISLHALLSMNKQIPECFNKDSGAKHNAIFTIDPWLPQDVIQMMPVPHPDIEKVFAGDQVIFWACPKKAFSKSMYGKMSAKPQIYSKVTVRNGNTFEKLVAIAEDYLERFGD